MNQTFSIRLEEEWGTVNNYKWTTGGYWSNQKVFIDEKTSDIVLKATKAILNQQSFTVNSNDIIYASPISDIPRFKLKEFIKEKKLKKTTRFQYADIIIMNRGQFNNFIKQLKKEEIIFFKGEFFKNIKDRSTFKSPGYAAKTDVMTLFNSSPNKDLTVTFDINEYSKKGFDAVIKKHPTLKKEIEDNTHSSKGIHIDFYREGKNEKLLQLILNKASDIINGKCKIVFDEDMFVELNKDGIELDDEYLKALRDMLFSKDKANVKLGFEMMSNLVLNQPTILSLSFLLNELYITADFRPSQYTQNNSNLKSLLTLFRTKGIHWDRDWKTFGTGLRSNFKEGKEGEIVKKFLLDNINREFKLSNSAAESLVDIVFTTEAKNIN
jgi:hypothetical protein